MIERELAEAKTLRGPVKSGDHPPAIEIAAKRVGVGRETVEIVAKLEKQAPDLAKKVRAGTMAAYAADYELRARQPRPKAKPPTVGELSAAARTAGQSFAKAVAALSKARGEFTFMELWAIWAAIFEVQGYLERMARQHRLPVPETPADLKRLKAKSE